MLSLTHCNPIKKDKKEFVFLKMKVKLAKIKHVYFISVSAKMYIYCGIHKWFSNCNLRATGGPLCPRWSCSQLQIPSKYQPKLVFQIYFSLLVAFKSKCKNQYFKIVTSAMIINLRKDFPRFVCVCVWW